MASHTQWQMALGCTRADESIEMHVETLDGQWIADICHHPDEAHHARLIASAPELMAALEACERELKDWCDYAAEHAADLIPTAQQETYAALMQARAAIRKARGAA